MYLRRNFFDHLSKPVHIYQRMNRKSKGKAELFRTHRQLFATLKICQLKQGTQTNTNKQRIVPIKERTKTTQH